MYSVLGIRHVTIGYCVHGIIYLNITILVFRAARCPSITSLDSKETVLKEAELNEAEQKYREEKNMNYYLRFLMFGVDWNINNTAYKYNTSKWVVGPLLKWRPHIILCLLGLHSVVL